MTRMKNHWEIINLENQIAVNNDCQELVKKKFLNVFVEDKISIDLWEIK